MVARRYADICITLLLAMIASERHEPDSGRLLVLRHTRDAAFA